MTDALIIRLSKIWHTSAQRNTWELVEDVPAFLKHVAQRFAGAAEPEDAALEIAIVRAYNAVLHSAFKQQDKREQAAYELWLTCIRMAHSWNLSDDQLESVAQEVIARMIKKIPQIDNPEATMLYMRQVIRTVVREQREDKPSISLDEAIETGSLVEPQAAQMTAVAAEQAVVEQEILELLRRKLPNALERAVLIRIVLLGEKPREIATELGITSHTVSVICYRVKQRLHADPEVRQFLE